jgi:hypothetical protein
MQDPLLIFVDKLTPRLDYICKFIFRDVLGLPFVFTESVQKYNNCQSPKMRYSLWNEPTDYFIEPINLLLESDIKPQKINVVIKDGISSFFETKSNILSFDILAASFYLLTRYEEYCPFNADKHNRYPHYESLAFKNNFLELPLINIWGELFLNSLKKFFPNLHNASPKFKHVPTYDIDMAFCYKHKNIFRQIGSVIQDLVTAKISLLRTRILVIRGKQKDPFDTFDLIAAQHQSDPQKRAIFFFLVGKYSMYDKNNEIYSLEMQQVIQSVAAYAEVGLHPSYLSNSKSNMVCIEKANLEKILSMPVCRSRQHYIKNILPETNLNLITNGITSEYSMGYGSANGFRASTCTPHRWFNLLNNKVENLQIIPFCWMDNTSLHYHKMTPQDALIDYENYFNICKKYNGTFVSIWHNSSLGNQGVWEGWQETYLKSLELQ